MRPVPVLSMALAVAVLSSGCVVPPSPGVPMPAPGAVVPADARALRYGSSAPEIFNNPQIAGSIRALFGPDWNPGNIAFGAPAYFPGSSSLRLVRVGDQEWIALSGCVPSACTTHPGLLLIRQDGGQLLARLDEGGFSHYYAHGPDAAMVPRPLIDGAWETIRRLERR